MLKGWDSSPILFPSMSIPSSLCGWRPGPFIFCLQGMCQACFHIRMLVDPPGGWCHSVWQCLARGRVSALLVRPSLAVAFFKEYVSSFDFPFIQSDHICVLTGTFRAYVFKVIPDKFGFNSPFMLSYLYCFICVLFSLFCLLAWLDIVLADILFFLLVWK